MTLAQARQILTPLGIVIRHDDGEYRVNFKSGPERTAYYTSDLADAVGTGRHMAREGLRGQRPHGNSEHNPPRRRGMSVREAAAKGAARGRASASWVFDGNTSEATLRAFLDGNEDGDPEVMDRYAPPSWLSGEWAGESIAEIFGDADAPEDVTTAYEQAAEEAYWRELERVAIAGTGAGRRRRR